jgi:hypothetical protein
LGTIFDFRQLVPHPATPPSAVAGVTCSVTWRDVGEWRLDFMVGSAAEWLRLPPPAPPARADGLWRQTCFEMFLRDPSSGEYLEFNFSPSGQWAAWRFDGYPTGRSDLEVAPPRIFTTDPLQFQTFAQTHLGGLGFDPEALRALAEVARQDARDMPPAAAYALSAGLEDPALPSGRDWLMGLSAIIEESDGTKSFWALAHPPGKPDFHHPDCFTLELPAAEPE